VKTYYVDGKFVPSNKAVIPVNDLAILRGYGVCDIMRTYKGQPYFLDAHITRLENSALTIGLSLPWSTQEIKNLVLETLDKNQPLDEANIRIIITGGSSTDFFYPQGQPRLLILITDIKKLPGTWYTKGVKVITHPLERTLPDAKVISYIPAAIALKLAKEKNAIEALYINRKMEVLEGTTSNLFAFFDKKLVTPRDGVLKGITRQAIISISKNIYNIEERPIYLSELLKADEVFITGTNKGVVPVTQIDETKIGIKPGINTKKIISELKNNTLEFIRLS
jgi:branched-chain amino acid aminotransferase